MKRANEATFYWGALLGIVLLMITGASIASALLVHAVDDYKSNQMKCWIITNLSVAGVGVEYVQTDNPVRWFVEFHPVDKYGYQLLGFQEITEDQFQLLVEHYK